MDQDLTTQMIKDLLSKVTIGETEEETIPATTGLMSSLPGTKTPENVAQEEEADDTPKARTTISKFINDLADAKEAEEAGDDIQYVTKETPEVSDILSLNTELLQNRHNTPLYDFIRKNKNINLNDGAISVRDRGDAGLRYIKKIGDMFKQDYTVPSVRPDVSVQRKPSVVLDLDLFMERYDEEDKVGTADVDISVVPDTTGADGGAATDKKGLMVKPQTDDDLGLPTERSVIEENIASRDQFILDVGKKMETDHGDTPKLTKDAREKDVPDDKKSLDVGYGHKIFRGGEEDTSGKIHGIKFKNDDGTYIKLTEKQKQFILNKDIERHTKMAREKGWDKKLKAINTSWDELDEDYKNVLSSLAFNVGGKKAGEKWTKVLQAAKDKDVAEFAKELRRNDAGSRTEGMDNRVAKELYYAGLITSLDDVSSELPLATAKNSGIPQSDDEEEI